MGRHELSKEFLTEQYISQGKTRYVISAETGVSAERIGSLLQQYGIKRYSVTRHGLSAHPLNAIWNGMKERCNNPNADNYKWYGALGVKVCEKWSEFMPFYEWAIENNWHDGLTVDRMDYSKDYSPDNCRLITMKQQCRNRRSNIYILQSMALLIYSVNGKRYLVCGIR